MDRYIGPTPTPTHCGEGREEKKEGRGGDMSACCYAIVIATIIIVD